jgi:putative oxidoreductase
MEICLDHQTVLSFLLRVILGILFFFQGYDKVFQIKMKGVIDSFKRQLGYKKIPNFLVVSSAWFTSYVELLCGGLLILGLFKTYALYILGIDLILVTGAFSIITPMWDMQLLFPRLILLAVILYIPSAWDVLSLDHFLSKPSV